MNATFFAGGKKQKKIKTFSDLNSWLASLNIHPVRVTFKGIWQHMLDLNSDFHFPNPCSKCSHSGQYLWFYQAGLTLFRLSTLQHQEYGASLFFFLKEGTSSSCTEQIKTGTKTATVVAERIQFIKKQKKKKLVEAKKPATSSTWLSDILWQMKWRHRERHCGICCL